MNLGFDTMLEKQREKKKNVEKSLYIQLIDEKEISLKTNRKRKKFYCKYDLKLKKKTIIP